MSLKIEVKRGESCYIVRFTGKTHMPQNEWLPMPFSPAATFATVADHLSRKFAPTTIVLLADEVL